MTAKKAPDEQDDGDFVHRFWMVYGIGQGAPRYHHHTKEAAVEEARRLAMNAPGVRFIVLAAIDAFTAGIKPVERLPLRKYERTSDDDIPF
jgi:hypothetical protein